MPPTATPAVTPAHRAIDLIGAGRTAPEARRKEVAATSENAAAQRPGSCGALGLCGEAWAGAGG